MEKEKLSNDLKGLVGQNSLSDRTWSDYIDNSVLPFVPEDETKVGDFLTKHANVLKSINGQLNHDVASKVDEFKKTYKPEPTKSAEQGKTTSDEKPEWAKELETKLAKIETEKAESEKAATKQKLLSDAKEILKSQDNYFNDSLWGLLKIDVPDGISASDLATNAKSAYDSAYKKLFGEGYNPAHGAQGGSGPVTPNPEAKKYKEAVAKDRERMRV